MGQIAVAVRHLIAAGVEGDDLVSAIEELENSAPKHVDEAAERRRKKDRERKRRQREASADICGNPEHKADIPQNSADSADEQKSPPTPPYKKLPSSDFSARGAQVQRVLDALGPGAVDPSKSPNMTISITRRIDQWSAAGWDLDLDVIPIVSQQTAKPRTKPLHSIEVLEADIALHHANRLKEVPHVEPGKAGNVEHLQHRRTRADGRRSDGIDALRARLSPSVAADTSGPASEVGNLFDDGETITLDAAPDGSKGFSVAGA